MAAVGVWGETAMARRACERAGVTPRSLASLGWRAIAANATMTHQRSTRRLYSPAMLAR